MTYRRTEHLQVLFDSYFSMLTANEQAVMIGWLDEDTPLRGVALGMKTTEKQVTKWRDSAVKKLRAAK